MRKCKQICIFAVLKEYPMIIDIQFLPEADAFLKSLPEKAQKKISAVLFRVSQGGLNPSDFKKLGESGIWEFRASWNGMCYRLLAFWDEKTKSLIIATHGFIKKSQKTPKSEIERAKQIRQRYYNSNNS